MLEKVKKYATIATIALLIALFNLSIVGLVIEQPDYMDFCFEQQYRIVPMQETKNCANYTQPSDEELKSCSGQKGHIEYKYDAAGCTTNYVCNTCDIAYNNQRKKHNLIGFIITSILGIIAVIIGIYVRSDKETIEWIFSGILIGGVLSIFIGTVSYYSDMGRYIKPAVLLAELILVIWIVLKTTGISKKGIPVKSGRRR